jgi:phosphoribosylformylglycinamidine (FGAM) synthase-like amidotransferase family enzyme
MMPHPERAVSSVLGNTDGKKVFGELLLGKLAEVAELSA